MKKILIFLMILMVISALPIAAYAYDHDQVWHDHHDRAWRDHAHDWQNHDREWREHSGDRYWRARHAHEWEDWYRWHRDNEGGLNIDYSDGNLNLDIDI